MTYLPSPDAVSLSEIAATNYSPFFHRRLTAALLIGQFTAMWVAFFILAPSIDWPASLDQPASVILPLILEKSLSVFLGYLFYAVHALLLIPIAALIPAALKMSPAMERNAWTFGALTGFAKALGITRWLFLMPMLATSFTDATTSEGGRAAIAAIYVAFNAYAGGVGEILGVGLFAGIWTILISIALIRAKSPILGGAGIVAALLLLSTLSSVVGIDSPLLLTLSGVLWQLWTFALAISLWRRC